MIPFDPNDTPWGECNGQLQELGVSIRDDRKRRQTRNAVGAFSLAAAVVVATGLLFAPPNANEAPAMALKCHEVAPLLASFEAGTLSDDLRRQVDAHLNICSHCRQELKKLRDARTSDVGRDRTTPLASVMKIRHVIAVRTVSSRCVAS